MNSKEKHEFPDWEQRYRETDVEKMPWYYKELEPDVREALKDLGLHEGRALDIGTGPGTQAMGLAAIGFEVTATDISGTAIDKARARAEAKGIKVDWKTDNILDTALTGKFDLIFDRGCFHTLDPELRDRYVDIVSGLLNPGGYLLLKTFSVKEPGQEGPYRFAPEDIEKYFSRKLEIILIRETVFQGTRKPLPKALFSIIRR